MTDADLEKGFQVAWRLHRDAVVGERITAQAWRVYTQYPKKLVKRDQESWRQWVKRQAAKLRGQTVPELEPARGPGQRAANQQPRTTTRRLPEACRFQYAVYEVSERWEKDQEGPRALYPKYSQATPTPEDYLVRYVKFLIWKTTDRARFQHLLGGLGCLLYAYAPQQIGTAASYFWDEPIEGQDVARIVNGAGANAPGVPGLSRLVLRRFPSIACAPNDPRTIDTKTPDADETSWVQEACDVFTPWDAFHAPPPPPAPATDSSAMAWTTWYQQRVAWAQRWSDWERVHVLIHRCCGGIPLLINTYNQDAQRMTNPSLPDPQGMLHIPRFDAPPPPSNPDPLARVVPPSSTSDRARSIRALYEDLRSRAAAGRFHLLRVYVDGEAQPPFRPAQGGGASFSIPLEASCIEVLGVDAAGEIPLTLFRLSDLDNDAQECQLEVRLEGGHSLTLQVSPVDQAETGDGTAYRLQVTYKEALRQRLLARLWRMWISCRDASAAVWRPVPLLTCGVLLSLTLHAYRMLTPSPWPADVARARASAQAVEQTEQTLHALTQQGLQAERAGHPMVAMAAYREALNQVALPLNQLAWLLYQQGLQAAQAGNPTAALDAYREGVRLARLVVYVRPDKANYLDTLAVLLCQVGEQAEAVHWMEKAAALEPRSFSEKLEQFRHGGCQGSRRPPLADQ